jgi:ABC-type multidrug transport system ATPase subunit
MHPDIYGVPQSETRFLIYKMMKPVELLDRTNDFVQNYSSGMRHYV